MPAVSINSKRRRLLSDCSLNVPVAPEPSIASVSKSSLATRPEGVCAKLVTTNERGQKEVIYLTLDHPVTIGRNRRDCSYVLDDKTISNIHCKLYGVLSSTGGALVSCQDFSTNGIILNGHQLRKSAAIVMDGDVLQLPNSRVFTCHHIRKEPREQLKIFEPTPPQGPMAYKKTIVGPYIVISHCLGSGSFASVHLAFNHMACKQVACKTVMTKSRNKTAMQSIMKEVTILRGLDHPIINKILDVRTNSENGWLHIFLELCTGGDLFTYILHRHCLSEPEAKFIMFQLMKGIEYLHSLNVSHRDLKPENILLYAPGPFPRIQIADFGLARPDAYQETKNPCGTVSYMPPEGILALDDAELGYVGMPADCWSAGLILFIMLIGDHPFDYRGEAKPKEESQTRLTEFSQGEVVSEEVIKHRIVTCSVWYSTFWDNAKDAKILIEGLLERDVSRRTTIDEALRSHWIQSEVDALKRDYAERINQNITS